MHANMEQESNVSLSRALTSCSDARLPDSEQQRSQHGPLLGVGDPFDAMRACQQCSSVKQQTMVFQAATACLRLLPTLQQEWHKMPGQPDGEPEAEGAEVIHVAAFHCLDRWKRTAGISHCLQRAHSFAASTCDPG